MQPTLYALKTFSYSDILGWSASRYDKFLLCRRQYFYDYYGKYDTEFGRAKAESLKKMTSIPLETGSIFHDSAKVLLERLLVSEKPIQKDKFLDFVLQKTREYCSAKIFSEVYYRTKEEIKIDLIFENLQKIVQTFLESPRFQWIVREAVTNKNGWVIEPPGYGETRIEGIKAYCKVDFLFPVKDQFYILDWKTGKRDEKKHRKQLTGYATWASFHFEAEPGRIHPIAVYLQPSFSEMEITVTKDDIRDFARQVKKETEELHACCRDIGFNIPKEKEAFPLTDNLGTCRYCNYRELCKRQ